MNILILGSGGREHALAWKFRQSSRLGKLFIAPGNAGTKIEGINVALDGFDFSSIGKFCVDEKIDMLVVGPEAPLVKGIYDFFQQQEVLKNIMVIGPSAAGAQLERSKAFAKKFMNRYSIPTAGYAEFTLKTLEKAFTYIDQQSGPIVLKCDGLAAGKGVVILEDKEEAKKEIKDMLSGKFGGAGNIVVIEDFLDGIEFSVFVVTNGQEYKILPVAKDYKRIGLADTGLNTGGMGAISPPPFVDLELMNKVISKIIEPTLLGIQKEKIEYKGIIFIGLIKVDNEPYVIEYNCRLGDPETEAVLPRLKSDLIDLFEGIYSGLDKQKVEILDKSAATVMLVSGGYPEQYEKGKIMTGFQKEENVTYFHAGTTMEKGNIVTTGGRVLAITSLDDDFKKAVAKSLEHAHKINFSGKFYRKDIGFDL
jgi:phosphoribosylamine--glycine ligase